MFSSSFNVSFALSVQVASGCNYAIHKRCKPFLVFGLTWHLGGLGVTGICCMTFVWLIKMYTAILVTGRERSDLIKTSSNVIIRQQAGAGLGKRQLQRERFVIV